MKTMILAAAAALTLGAGSAYAGDGEGPVANTQFTELPNVIAQAPSQDNHAYAANQSGSAYATQQRPTVVFPWSSRG
jgi:opacity protein-like surface antigen